MDQRGAKQDQARPVETMLKEARLRHVNRSDPVVVKPGTPMREVISLMQETQSGGVLVVGPSGGLSGIFTERDYLDRFALGGGGAQGAPSLETPIERFMTASPRTLSPDHPLGDAIRWMIEGGYRHIPLVEDGGKVFGLVSAGDVVQFIAEYFPTEVYNLPPRLHQNIRTLDGG